MTRHSRTRLTIAFALFLGLPPSLFAQGDNRRPFLAYEISEMGMNNFRHFAGEAGLGFGTRYRARLSVMEVAVTERDLAGWWSAAVDGRNVRGYLRGYELHVDRFFKDHWYVSANAGYYANEFRHTRLDRRIWNETLTAGVGIGYSRTNLLGVKRLHLDVSLPIRYYFDGIDETRLGDATVNEHRIVPNTWVFVGYRF